MIRTAPNGFTLVEMLVALVISALLAVVVFGALNVAMRSSQSMSRIQQESGRAFTIQHSLRRILSSARNERIRDLNGVQQSAFRGSEREIIFVAPLTQITDSNRLFWLKLSVETSPSGEQQLVLKHRQFQPINEDDQPEPLQRNQLDWEELLLEFDLNSATEVLYTSPGDEFRFEYQAVDDTNNTQWLDEWVEERDLPVMIRIHFNGEYSADWPDLMVAPKDNAYAIKTLL